MSEEPSRTLKLAYANMWSDFDPDDNFLSRLLSERFVLEGSDSPELLIYSKCQAGQGLPFQNFKCLRLLVNWENKGWGFSSCDFAITCDLVEHPDHYRFPFYAVHLPQPFQQPLVDLDRVLLSKTGFASVVVSNPWGSTRNRVHDLLDRYKPVASGGRFRNNVGGAVADKLAFISRYKFCVAFENSSYPGYTTEKILDALAADTVPIYWGNPDIANEFNADRFINYHEFESEEALLARVIDLDRNEGAYLAMLEQPWFRNGRTPECADPQRLLDWLDSKICDERTPVARRRSPLNPVRRMNDKWRIRARFKNRVL